jgi:predicted nucleotidyltransferase component of viral defense system
MKDYLKQQVESIQDANLARCITREYLQARLLECLQENGAFANWAFVGGTALRFLYSMPRFSEDLDFSLTKPSIEDDFTKLMKKAKVRFQTEDYSVIIKAKTEKTVKSALVKFDELLFQLIDLRLFQLKWRSIQIHSPGPSWKRVL